MTAVEFLESQYKFNQQLFKSDFQQAKEMEREALAIIRKFVNEFDEEGEVSWNTRDEAHNFLNNL